MIDVHNIVKFDRTHDELIEFATFCVCVAGKSAKTVAAAINRLDMHELHRLSEHRLAEKLRSVGIGCYNQKAKTLYQLYNSSLDLRTCSSDDLETIPGIGPKTSRFFLLYTRPNQDVAVLDTHILKFLREQGVKAPTQTPQNIKRYKKLEVAYLSIARAKRISPLGLDIQEWTEKNARVNQ